MKKKIHNDNLLLILLITLLGVAMTANTVSAATATQTAKGIRVYVQNKEIHPRAASVIQGGSVYVEFRSVVQALGIKFKYDAAGKQITATSEDATFKVDLKTKKTFVNGSPYTYDSNVPMVIGSGADALVAITLYSETDYISADYDKTNKIVKVYEDLHGKPKKADLKKIQALIKAHYQTLDGFQSIDKLEMESWREYTVMLADVSFRKTETELLDRVEHVTLEMEHKPDASWTIHNIEINNTEYLDYTSLINKEVNVPAADQMAIHELLAAYCKAIKDKDVDAELALQDPANLTAGDEKSLRNLREWSTRNFDLEYTEEQAVIVSYSANQAVVYWVCTLQVKKDSSKLTERLYSLTSVVKNKDKWYFDSNEEIALGSEVIE
ncbi:stalk domain-containing protein [Paenibacillus piscarius]|uniref:stalk domain-containing protein n=1 Tax=Paenibacillus piscarius TaxID=1089681 RepID=UPI001EE7A430|nr:stalk domain-containing protein [Paenibacillus piscarius]